MSNHKSAQKRARQNIKRNLINKSLLQKVKNKISNFEKLLESKKTEDLQKHISQINSALAKAAKKGIVKKQYLARKLSSLSKYIKK